VDEGFFCNTSYEEKQEGSHLQSYDYDSG